jgi:hypothetical protein
MMQVPDTFVRTTRGAWTVWARQEWIPHVAALIGEARQSDGWSHHSKHARTRPLDLAGMAAAYLKSYQPYRWSGMLKDAVRSSKPCRALVMSEQLRGIGIATPGVLAAGECRAWGILSGGFLLTAAVVGPEVHALLGSLAGEATRGQKRAVLRALGGQVARLHDTGFYHGDLVPTNIRVRGQPAQPTFVFLDHDRTRALGRPVPLRSARRNLVQLNRFVVIGLTASDRWRVFTAYRRGRGLDDQTGRRLARWVMRKTVERRRRFDGIVDAEQIGFRAVMRIDGTRSARR